MHAYSGQPSRRLLPILLQQALHVGAEAGRVFVELAFEFQQFGQLLLVCP